MPRVGSSISTTSGSMLSQRASTTFCWLPPERNCTSWPRLCGDDVEAGQHARASRAGRSPYDGGRPTRTTPRALSRIDWLSASPLALRSSVMKARRARTPWRGLLTSSGAPSRVTLPRATGWTPKTVSSSSVRPEPWRPARPTISPARTVERRRRRRSRCRHRTGPRRTSPTTTSSGLSGKYCVSGRPTISRTSSPSVSSSAGRVATCWPSLRMVMVWQRSKISLSRWET